MTTTRDVLEETVMILGGAARVWKDSTSGRRKVHW